MLCFSRGEKIVIGICLCILTACAGAWVYLLTCNTGFLSAKAIYTESPLPPVEKPDTVVVHVAGRVRRPGVYELRVNRRVLDAIRTAGGALPKADLDNLNLAAVLEDGQKIYVPHVSEPVASLSLPRTPRDESRPQKAVGLPPHSINLNRANVDELQQLPGVGPATARSIIEYRKTAGGFRKVEDLLNVRGIGPKKFAKMKPYLRV